MKLYVSWRQNSKPVNNLKDATECMDTLLLMCILRSDNCTGIDSISNGSLTRYQVEHRAYCLGSVPET